MKIQIQTKDGHFFDLTLDQARDVYEQLRALFEPVKVLGPPRAGAGIAAWYAPTVPLGMEPLPDCIAQSRPIAMDYEFTAPPSPYPPPTTES